MNHYEKRYQMSEGKHMLLWVGLPLFFALFSFGVWALALNDNKPDNDIPLLFPVLLVGTITVLSVRTLLKGPPLYEVVISDNEVKVTTAYSVIKAEIKNVERYKLRTNSIEHPTRNNEHKWAELHLSDGQKAKIPFCIYDPKFPAILQSINPKIHIFHNKKEITVDELPERVVQKIWPLGKEKE